MGIIDRSYYEKKAWQNHQLVLGIDEAGRGPLAGPLVVAGVILKMDTAGDLIDDSKKLSPKQRTVSLAFIQQHAVAIAVEIVSEKVIDQLNILRATKEAMQKIVDKLAKQADYILSDAIQLQTDIQHYPLIKGDQKSISIGAASIIAKEIRDDIMRQYDVLYPDYGFAKHKGYPTKAHYEALAKLGISPIHRQSFRLFK